MSFSVVGVLHLFHYIGLHKMGYETLRHPWWINNVSVSYTGWLLGDPESFDTENCVIISKGGWRDLPCVYTSNFICEKNKTYKKLT